MRRCGRQIISHMLKTMQNFLWVYRTAASFSMCYFGSKSNLDSFYWGVNYGARGFNSSLAYLSEGDSLLPGRCLVPLEHVLSGWWCGPPEGGWWCPCLHSRTGRWSSSTWPAPGVPSPLAAAHMGCETMALQWREESCESNATVCVQGFKCLTWCWLIQVWALRFCCTHWCPMMIKSSFFCLHRTVRVKRGRQWHADKESNPGRCVKDAALVQRTHTLPGELPGRPRKTAFTLYRKWPFIEPSVLMCGVGGLTREHHISVRKLS